MEEAKSGIINKNRLIWIAAAVVVVAVIYFIFDPVSSNWMPQCLFHRFTGLQCTGCGTQRMLHALLHGDFEAAFHYNMFLFCMMPVLIFFLGLEMSRKKFPKLYAKFHSVWLIAVFGVMVVGWTVVRNIYGI